MNAFHLKLYKWFCIEIFCLIAFGGAVRAMNAGLACPDWPLCFGQVIPDYHPQVYFEFIHRVLAGLVSIMAVYLNFRLIRDRAVATSTKWVAGAAVLLLVGQVVMGGLTVLLQLQDKIVAGHLALGTAFFAFTLWAYLSMVNDRTGAATEKVVSAVTAAAKPLTVFLLVAVYGQILLGGLVASNYAGLLCSEFPLCQGQFIPTLHGSIGLHVIHRLGAYALAIIVAAYSTVILSREANVEMRKWAKVLLGLLSLQFVVGIANVLTHTPPLITVLHLAMGVSLLAAGVKLLRVVTLAPVLAHRAIGPVGAPVMGGL
jgi:cytochrome c oxidase assembly protein subunit 15